MADQMRLKPKRVGRTSRYTSGSSREKRALTAVETIADLDEKIARCIALPEESCVADPAAPYVVPYLPRWLIVRLAYGGRAAVHSVLGQVHAARSSAPHYTAFRTSPRNRDQLFINPKRSIAFPMWRRMLSRAPSMSLAPIAS
jgi:hypothetical protein